MDARSGIPTAGGASPDSSARPGKPAADPADDVLGEMLEAARLTGTIGDPVTFQPPWTTHQDAGQIPFYLLLRGRCLLEVGDLPEPVELDAGDLALVIRKGGIGFATP